MPSRVDRLEKRKKKINKKIGKSMARQEDRGKRKAGEETRLEQRQKKTYDKGIKAIREGKGKKAMRILKKTGDQQKRMEKRNKGETGLYPIIRGVGSNKGGTTYGGKVKTSGLRKRAKKNR